ncbi:MAG TPA: hypothetical protein VMT03_25580 [Polyangia bacterium]|nr:hypothetical protein [Polyangia bacterium]
MGLHARWLASALIACLLGCGGGGSESGVPAGRESGPCYSDKTCNAGLACVANVCVLKQVVDSGRVPVDAGTTTPTDAAFQPAPHPALPQVADLGGTVIASPRVQPVVFAADTSAQATTTFLSQMAQSSYWQAATAEYGVGTLEVLPAITLSSQPPATITDQLIQSTISDNTSGSNPAWGPADPSTIYLMVLPSGTIGSLPDGSTCCHDFGGYHGQAPVDTSNVPYAVSCSCAGAVAGQGLTSLQQRTMAISHELIEASTDPFPGSNPAYAGTENADLIWTVITGGEVADMCAFNPDLVYTLPGTSYAVQRSWSNLAAKATTNPCVPAPSGPYFNSFPALTSITVSAGGMTFPTQGLVIPLGQSKTVDVTLFSTAPIGDWTVNAYTLEEVLGETNTNLALSLDKGAGTNGDVLHLTLAPKSANASLGGEGFVLISQYGQPGSAQFQTNLSMGLIVN